MRTFVLSVTLLSASLLFARNPDADMKVVDSGTFGIFQSGQRIATETFRIEQNAIRSVTRSEIKSGDGANESSQSSELELLTNGDLVKYSWHELKPDKSDFTLAPDQQVLVQHYVGNKTSKDLPYILTASTSVLDDYFFIQREVLAWRYLAGQCPNQPCQLSPADFRVVVPHQHLSGTVRMEFKGREKVAIKGAPTELNHLVLHADELDWSLYLNDDQRLVKVEIPAQQTEAVRE
jgi:hypothetical protein